MKKYYFYPTKNKDSVIIEIGPDKYIVNVFLDEIYILHRDYRFTKDEMKQKFSYLKSILNEEDRIKLEQFLLKNLT